jgi:predicted ABC-type ATPase
VLAGTNGAGKSSVAGALIRSSGGDYFNPDEVAKRLRSTQPGLTQRQAGPGRTPEWAKPIVAAALKQHAGDPTVE